MSFSDRLPVVSRASSQQNGRVHFQSWHFTTFNGTSSKLYPFLDSHCFIFIAGIETLGERYRKDILFSCSPTKIRDVWRLCSFWLAAMPWHFKPLAGKITSHISNISLRKSHVVLLCRKPFSVTNCQKHAKRFPRPSAPLIILEFAEATILHKVLFKTVHAPHEPLLLKAFYVLFLWVAINL